MAIHRECACLRCIMACVQAPGLLKRDDVARIADYLNIPVAELCDTRLEIVGGAMRPRLTHDGCTFLVGQRCSIHAVKPFECREAMHDLTREQADDIHNRALEDWKDGVTV